MTTVAGKIADWSRSSGALSTLSARRLFNSVGFGLQVSNKDRQTEPNTQTDRQTDRLTFTGRIADWSRSSGALSTLSARRLFNSVGFGLQVILKDRIRQDQIVMDRQTYCY